MQIAPGMMRDVSIATRLELTLLRPDATEADFRQLCNDAVDWGVRAVSVAPWAVPDVVQYLRYTGVRVVTVSGFPHGTQTLDAKVGDAVAATQWGADEVDIVLNAGLFFSRRYKEAEYGIRTIVRECSIPVRVILETCRMSDTDIVHACNIAEAGGASFVKTGTGTIPDGGATVRAVRIMRETCHSMVKIYAAGGIRSNVLAHELVDAGAELLCSSTVGTLVCPQVVIPPRKY